MIKTAEHVVVSLDGTLFTAIFDPSVPRRIDMIERTASAGSETHTTETVEGTTEVSEENLPYSVPPSLEDRYLISVKFEDIRELMYFSPAKRRLVIYFDENCVKVFDRCTKLLGKIEDHFIKDAEVKFIN